MSDILLFSRYKILTFTYYQIVDCIIILYSKFIIGKIFYDKEAGYSDEVAAIKSMKEKLGIKNDDNSPEVATLVKSFGHSKYVNSINFDNMQDIESAIVRSKIKGAVVIPNDFSSKLSRGQKADLLVITDGSEVNTANYVQSYALSISNQWLATSKYRGKINKPIINAETRMWYNPDLNSHHFIVPSI